MGARREVVRPGWDAVLRVEVRRLQRGANVCVVRVGALVATPLAAETTRDGAVGVLGGCIGVWVDGAERVDVGIVIVVVAAC